VVTITQEAKAVRPQKRTLFISLRIKLLIVFTLLFVVVVGGVYLWFLQFTTDAVMRRLKDDLGTLMTGVSAQIDGDQFAQMVEEGGQPTDEGFYPPKENTPYWDQAAFLYQMRSIDPRARFFTYTRGSNPGEVVFVGSSSALADPPGGVKFMQSITFGQADAEVILGGLERPTYYLTIYQDEFGRWISGYIPIKNSAGQTVGALGVDILASYVREVQDEVRNAIIPAVAITYLVLIGLVYLVSGVLTRPVRALTLSADRIGEGDYEQDLSGLTRSRLPDEITSLAKVFDIMVSKVRQREEKLKQQVHELRIMIDEGKRKQQVEEIVDTDFFRDLQVKARAMRADFAARSE
jgi:HAMP domain-containing protein